MKLAHQAAAAIEFMHFRDVLHRDLTSNNLLITDKWELKVGPSNRQACFHWVTCMCVAVRKLKAVSMQFLDALAGRLWF